MYPTLALNSLGGFDYDLELQIFLPPPPKYWYVPPYTVYSTLIKANTSCLLGKHSVILSHMPSPVILSLSLPLPPPQCACVCVCMCVVSMHMYMVNVYPCVLHVGARGGH